MWKHGIEPYAARRALRKALAESINGLARASKQVCQADTYDQKAEVHWSAKDGCSASQHFLKNRVMTTMDSMKRTLSRLSLVLAGCTACSAGFALDADTVLKNGNIYTPQGWVKAAAIKHGVIVDMGDDATVQKDAGSKTRVIDLGGATVLPGLHDMHVHPTGSGLMHLSCVFPQGLPPEKIIAAVKDCASHHKPGEWITGGQWDASTFGSLPVDRELLDKVAPDNPVALTDISIHALWLNTKALQIVGITKDTPNPTGGVIERRAGSSEPTGVVREGVRELVQRHIPPATPEQTAGALKWAVDQILQYGVTAFTDAGIGEAEMQAYDSLADRGQLKQRVLGCVGWHPNLAAPGDVGAAIVNRNLYARDRFHPDCVKIFLDGVPTEGHTAAMLEPYADAALADPARAKGILMVPPSVLNAAVIRFDSMGLVVKFHAAGDAAVHAGLDAIEAARKANGFSGLLHDVGHNSFVAPADIQRARALGAVFEMSPYIWYPNPIIPGIQKAIGPERMKRWIPVKDALDAGALVIPGSDWAVVPSVNPWIAIETLVTRQQLGGGGEVLGAQERITLKQAIDLFTVNSARQMGMGNKTGRLETGWLADLIVVDQNPFAVPITQVHSTKVKMVMINGEIVRREGFAD